MNFLLDELPESVCINGKEYDIDTDFSTSIRFELLMTDSTVSKSKKILYAINLYFDVMPDDVVKAFDKIFWFYTGGEAFKKSAKANGGAKRIYSFEYDSEYIYAAFLADYGIDLQATHLHWWKFKALFGSLKEENMINKIMSYRAMDISKLKGEERRYYQKLKKQFAIPLPKSEQEKIDKMNEILMNGGNVAKAIE